MAPESLFQTLCGATLLPFFKRIQETFSADYLGPKEDPIMSKAAGSSETAVCFLLVIFLKVDCCHFPFEGEICPHTESK